MSKQKVRSRGMRSLGPILREGRVDLKEAYEFLLPKVQDEARRQNRTQVPEFMPKGAVLDAALR